MALRRARESAGIEVGAAETLIVGDSVLDVGCARTHGIPSLAVATGFTPADELRAAGADWVVRSLLAVDGCHPALVAAGPTQGRL